MNRSKNIRDQKSLEATRFLEELSWLLATYSKLELRSLSEGLKRVVESPQFHDRAVGGYVSSKPNKQFLVGVLPRIFVDTELFSTNEDIAEFASSVMGLGIPWSHKKSRYELIGHIVCNTDNLDDLKLKQLAKALDILVSKGEPVRQFVLQRRRSNFGWNEVVQSLANEET